MFASAMLATLATGPVWVRGWLACAGVQWCQDPHYPNDDPVQAKGTWSLRKTLGSSEEQSGLPSLVAWKKEVQSLKSQTVHWMRLCVLGQ